LQNFGIYSNYSYVSSNIEEFYPWWSPLSASGIAQHTATVDLWYSSRKFEGRLGYKYHSDYSLIYGWTGSDVRTLESEGILGLSLAYQINDRMGFRLQANNLTDESLRIYRDNSPNRLGRYDVYGRSYLLDFTYGF
jgi:outer membrane receptor protein involved in Fe transport